MTVRSQPAAMALIVKWDDSVGENLESHTRPLPAMSTASLQRAFESAISIAARRSGSTQTFPGW